MALGLLVVVRPTAPSFQLLMPPACPACLALPGQWGASRTCRATSAAAVLYFRRPYRAPAVPSPLSPKQQPGGMKRAPRSPRAPVVIVENLDRACAVLYLGDDGRDAPLFAGEKNIFGGCGGYCVAGR